MKAIYTPAPALLPVFLVAALLATTLTVIADESGYTLTWWTVDAGGVTAQGRSNGYTLSGTAGQPDASVWTGGRYTLTGGFWVSGLTAVSYQVYLPVVVRND